MKTWGLLNKNIYCESDIKPNELSIEMRAQRPDISGEDTENGYAYIAQSNGTWVFSQEKKDEVLELQNN